MPTKQKLNVFDQQGNPTTINVLVVDDESELYAIEEPPEPVITVTYDNGERLWIVSGDENAEHREYREEFFRGNSANELAQQAAYYYAKQWAKAVRGVVESV